MLLFPSGTLLVAAIAVFPVFDDNVDAKLLAALVNGDMTQEEYDAAKKVLSGNGGVHRRVGAGNKQDCAFGISCMAGNRNKAVGHTFTMGQEIQGVQKEPG